MRRRPLVVALSAAAVGLAACSNPYTPAGFERHSASSTPR